MAHEIVTGEHARAHHAGEIWIRAADGHRLGATIAEPPGPPSATLIVDAATAVPQRYYAPFAAWMAHAGVRVVTYDYRGLGRSRPPALRGFDATMADWARLDASAVHRDTRARFGGPIVHVGHSFGGTALGLTDALHDAAGLIVVGAQLSCLPDFAWPERAGLALAWHGLVPAATALFGYLPGWLGLGTDLPAGVARQWARWFTHPRNLLAFEPEASARFAGFPGPVLLYSFTDDRLVPERGARALAEALPRGEVVHRRLSPRDLGVRAIGHFGFFRPAIGQPLWSEALAFVEAVADGRRPAPLAPRPRSSEVPT